MPCCLPCAGKRTFPARDKAPQLYVCQECCSSKRQVHAHPCHVHSSFQTLLGPAICRYLESKQISCWVECTQKQSARASAGPLQLIAASQTSLPVCTLSFARTRAEGLSSRCNDCPACWNRGNRQGCKNKHQLAPFRSRGRAVFEWPPCEPAVHTAAPHSRQHSWNHAAPISASPDAAPSSASPDAAPSPASPDAAPSPASPDCPHDSEATLTLDRTPATDKSHSSAMAPQTADPALSAQSKRSACRRQSAQPS